MEYEESDSSHSDFMNLDFKNQFNNSSSNRQSKVRVAASLTANKQREMFAMKLISRTYCFPTCLMIIFPFNRLCWIQIIIHKVKILKILMKMLCSFKFKVTIIVKWIFFSFKSRISWIFQSNQSLKSINYEKSHSKN